MLKESKSTVRGYMIAWALKAERAVFNRSLTRLSFMSAFVEEWGWFSSALGARCGKSSCVLQSQVWSQQLQPLQCRHWVNCSGSEMAGAAWRLSHRNSSRVITPSQSPAHNTANVCRAQQSSSHYSINPIASEWKCTRELYVQSPKISPGHRAKAE